MTSAPHGPVRIVALAEDQADASAALLARAFQDDPLFITCCPDPAGRARWLPWLFRWGVWQGLLLGQLLGTAGRLDGVAGLLGPAGGHLTDDQLARSGYFRGREELGAELWDGVNARLKIVFDEASDALHRVVTEPHWYLDLLGVEPTRQGAGIGGALLRTVSERAGADGLPVVLFTCQPRNLPFYQRHGYRVVSQGTTPDADLSWWGMRRDPEP